MTVSEVEQRAKKLKRTIVKLRVADEYNVDNLMRSVEKQWREIRMGFLPERFSKRRSSRWVYIKHSSF